MFTKIKLIFKSVLLNFVILAGLFTLFSVSATGDIDDTEAEIEKQIELEQIDKDNLDSTSQKTSGEPPTNQEPKVPCPHVPECTG